MDSDNNFLGLSVSRLPFIQRSVGEVVQALLIDPDQKGTG
jgi:hypothetical protein